MNYTKINNLFGWLAFIIALFTYTMTLEPSVSFWDCGEFISCAYRLQVSHQPGYPLFAMIGKVFSLLSFGDRSKVAYFTNMASAIASSATIMFLFWTITALSKKLLLQSKGQIEKGQTLLIMGAGMVGALALTFSDTFWFSAVETIVFAQSALCTALVFWAILKWDAHADEPGADKWLIFIAYVMGLSIGIHLLNLLTIPAIALVYYFRRSSKVNVKGTLVTLMVGMAILAFVLYGMIQYVVKLAAYSDLLFVNTFGLGFGSGAITFIFLLISILVYGIYYSTIKNKRILNLALLCCAFILLGYSSFAMLVIRAKAGTHLNNSNPDNAFTLLSYLNRDQYGERPLLYGHYYDSNPVAQESGSNQYRKGEHKYEVAGQKQNVIYDRNTILPRMYSDDPSHVEFYKYWMNIPSGQSPTFSNNIGFMFSWQLQQMYFRYFMWNFAGRNNDQDGQNNATGVDGNWNAGFMQGGKQLPLSVTQHKNYTRLYCLPLIIGLLGAYYHFRKRRKDALIVALLFFFTGIAIVLYLNQNPLQPRERDYAYAGSFYAFAIWIGFGVLALADILQKKLSPKVAGITATTICLLAAPALMASQEWKGHDRSTKTMARDMAMNYLNSCAKDAILFTYGDNDTYPLWYAQEVEGVRPDVRIVNLSLLGTDWYIRQMKGKMNSSAPLPITMPDSKYVQGVREVLRYQDYHLKEAVELKSLFDVLISDNDDDKATNPDGSKDNFLPTKNMKLTVDPDQVIATGTLPASDKGKIATQMDWQYNKNYVSKAELAMFDILAHNNWKRPIYYAVTVGNDNLIGLNKYLYKEGFTYRLLPFKTDTLANSRTDNINTLVMYDNVMNKFKWGNLKQARYLDHESTNMFYPLLANTLYSLADKLYKEGHPDLAIKVIQKYQQEMPDIYPYMEIAGTKLYLANLAFQLGETATANTLLNGVFNYVDDQLSYDARQLAKGPLQLDLHDVQVGISLFAEMEKITDQYKQDQLNAKLVAKLKSYQQLFAPYMQQ